MNSSVISSDQLLQQLQWRYATKKFDNTKKIPLEIWKVLEQSLVLSPSSFGLQPWKFFILTDREIRQQLVEHSWKQNQVVDASHLVVLTIKKDINNDDVDRLVKRMAEVRQTSLESLEGYGNVVKGFLKEPPYPLNLNEWSTRQVYIALGQFMTSAAILGIDTCPIEGFNPPKYDEILGLTQQGYGSVVVCAAGYRAADDKYASIPKVRYPTEEVVQYL
ncbi:nitroreductase [Gloeothece citriformis PCC 7424]|uniref:Nitroreductase n=1 Tax=Gloeothece citriformis (strain PCC 7424) TaxID=65393 RepID=B7KA16_GLOC7|nr:NAD(P)H-dependent oxidoreductase [Gloeothece citriformis]ACK71372.1 nitroreductase [Gloeothece citriformis PCC 7424]